jgi:hypothetical protein
MAQGKDPPRQANAYPGSTSGMHPFLNNPMMTILAELNGTLLESVATAQKDWVNFLYRRIREDVAVTRQLMKCHSIGEMHHVYSQYLQNALEQYQEQSKKVVQRGESIAQHVAETTEATGIEGARARH